MLTGIFYQPGDQWKSFRILRGDIPKVEELAQYDTIILSGSSHCVNKMPLQMEKFQEILLQTLKANKQLKVMGICFGHQFIAHSNKAEITSKELNKGLLNINFSLEDLSNVPYF